RIPDRDFEHDTRQNWSRICRSASLILTACRFTATAFRSSEVRCPVAVVPVPVNPDLFTIPAWDARHTWSLVCRSSVLRGETIDEASPLQCASETAADAPGISTQSPGSGRARIWRLARRGYHRVYPWLDPRSQRGVAKARQLIRAALQHSPP